MRGPGSGRHRVVVVVQVRHGISIYICIIAQVHRVAVNRIRTAEVCDSVEPRHAARRTGLSVIERYRTGSPHSETVAEVGGRSGDGELFSHIPSYLTKAPDVGDAQIERRIATYPVRHVLACGDGCHKVILDSTLGVKVPVDLTVLVPIVLNQLIPVHMFDGWSSREVRGVPVCRAIFRDCRRTVRQRISTTGSVELGKQIVRRWYSGPSGSGWLDTR